MVLVHNTKEFLGVGCLHPLPLTLSFTAPPPKTHVHHPLTLARHAQKFQKVHRKIRLSSGWNFERRSRSREPVVETFEHCFRSPLVTTITPAMCNRVCSSCTWHPRPAVSFARRILWLECDCKGGDEQDIFRSLLLRSGSTWSYRVRDIRRCWEFSRP